MTKKLAVAVIHGMGAQRKDKNAGSEVLTFSKKMHDRIRTIVGATDFDAGVEWREIYWASVLQDRQDAYFQKIVGMTDFDALRRYVMFNLSDAASYRQVPRGSADDTYEQVHKRFAGVIAELAASVRPDAPLMILAHSLGGHVTSNYIYDMQKAIAAGRKRGVPKTAIERMETVTRIVTFGCNIPVFVFAYPEDDIRPIAYPGKKLPPEQQLKPWWLNFYDRDDVLGFPLAQTAPKYEKLVTDGEIADVEVNAGGILTSWNPASHNAYWSDDDVCRPVAARISALIRP